MQEFLLSFISFDAILALDWKIKGPALLIIGWLTVRALASMFKFRFIQAATSFSYAFLLAVILSWTGSEIQSYLLTS